MKQGKSRKDFQTVSVFIILAFLTAIFVLGLRVVLYAPNLEQKTLVVEPHQAGK